MLKATPTETEHHIQYSTIKADKHATWITVTVELHKSFVVDLYKILIRATSYCLFVIISVIFDISKIKVNFSMSIFAGAAVG